MTTERRRAWLAEYNTRNAELLRAQKRRHYQENRERITAERRARYRADRDAARVARRAYEEQPEVRERLRSRDRVRYQRHRAKRIALAKANKARRKGAVGSFSAAEWSALVARFDWRCAYCGVTPERLTADHVVPISRGGSNTLDNIVPACGPCNRRKSKRTAAEYIPVALKDAESELSVLEQQIRALRASAPRYFGKAEQLALVTR